MSLKVKQCNTSSSNGGINTVQIQEILDNYVGEKDEIPLSDSALLSLKSSDFSINLSMAAALKSIISRLNVERTELLTFTSANTRGEVRRKFNDSVITRSSNPTFFEITSAIIDLDNTTDTKISDIFNISDLSMSFTYRRRNNNPSTITLSGSESLDDSDDIIVIDLNNSIIPINSLVEVEVKISVINKMQDEFPTSSNSHYIVRTNVIQGGTNILSLVSESENTINTYTNDGSILFRNLSIQDFSFIKERVELGGDSGSGSSSQQQHIGAFNQGVYTDKFISDNKNNVLTQSFNLTGIVRTLLFDSLLSDILLFKISDASLDSANSQGFSNVFKLTNNLLDTDSDNYVYNFNSSLANTSGEIIINYSSSKDASILFRNGLTEYTIPIEASFSQMIIINFDGNTSSSVTYRKITSLDQTVYTASTFRAYNLAMQLLISSDIKIRSLEMTVKGLTLSNDYGDLIKSLFSFGFESRRFIGSNSQSIDELDRSIGFVGQGHTDYSNIDGIIKNIFRMLDRIKNNEEKITSNTNKITSNNTLITTNTSNITTNTSKIGTNQNSIDFNTNIISNHSNAINANTPKINKNITDIAKNKTDIAAIDISGIATNTGNITTNTGNISTNTTNISTNTTNISTNATNIAKNKTLIDNISTSKDPRVATNAEDIISNVINIQENAADIESNTAARKLNNTNININLSKINTNTTNITTNRTNITKNTTDIGTDSDASHSANIYSTSSSLISNIKRLFAIDAIEKAKHNQLRSNVGVSDTTAITKSISSEISDINTKITNIENTETVNEYDTFLDGLSFIKQQTLTGMTGNNNDNNTGFSYSNGVLTLPFEHFFGNFGIIIPSTENITLTAGINSNVQTVTLNSIRGRLNIYLIPTNIHFPSGSTGVSILFKSLTTQGSVIASGTGNFILRNVKFDKTLGTPGDQKLTFIVSGNSKEFEFKIYNRINRYVKGFDVLPLYFDNIKPTLKFIDQKPLTLTKPQQSHNTSITSRYEPDNKLFKDNIRLAEKLDDNEIFETGSIYIEGSSQSIRINKLDFINNNLVLEDKELKGSNTQYWQFVFPTPVYRFRIIRFDVGYLPLEIGMVNSDDTNESYFSSKGYMIQFKNLFYIPGSGSFKKVEQGDNPINKLKLKIRVKGNAFISQKVITPSSSITTHDITDFFSGEINFSIYGNTNFRPELLNPSKLGEVLSNTIRSNMFQYLEPYENLYADKSDRNEFAKKGNIYIEGTSTDIRTKILNFTEPFLLTPATGVEEIFKITLTSEYDTRIIKFGNSRLPLKLGIQNQSGGDKHFQKEGFLLINKNKYLTSTNTLINIPSVQRGKNNEIPFMFELDTGVNANQFFSGYINIYIFGNVTFIPKLLSPSNLGKNLSTATRKLLFSLLDIKKPIELQSLKENYISEGTFSYDGNIYIEGIATDISAKTQDFKAVTSVVTNKLTSREASVTLFPWIITLPSTYSTRIIRFDTGDLPFEIGLEEEDNTNKQYFKRGTIITHNNTYFLYGTPPTFNSYKSTITNNAIQFYVRKQNSVTDTEFFSGYMYLYIYGNEKFLPELLNRPILGRDLSATERLVINSVLEPQSDSIISSFKELEGGSTANNFILSGNVYIEGNISDIRVHNLNWGNYLNTTRNINSRGIDWRVYLNNDFIGRIIKFDVNDLPIEFGVIPTDSTKPAVWLKNGYFLFINNEFLKITQAPIAGTELLTYRNTNENNRIQFKVRSSSTKFISGYISLSVYCTNNVTPDLLHPNKIGHLSSSQLLTSGSALLSKFINFTSDLDRIDLTGEDYNMYIQNSYMYGLTHNYAVNVELKDILSIDDDAKLPIFKIDKVEAGSIVNSNLLKYTISISRTSSDTNYFIFDNNGLKTFALKLESDYTLYTLNNKRVNYIYLREYASNDQFYRFYSTPTTNERELYTLINLPLTLTFTCPLYVVNRIKISALKKPYYTWPYSYTQSSNDLAFQRTALSPYRERINIPCLLNYEQLGNPADVDTIYYITDSGTSKTRKNNDPGIMFLRGHVAFNYKQADRFNNIFDLSIKSLNYQGRRNNANERATELIFRFEWIGMNNYSSSLVSNYKIRQKEMYVQIKFLKESQLIYSFYNNIGQNRLIKNTETSSIFNGSTSEHKVPTLTANSRVNSFILGHYIRETNSRLYEIGQNQQQEYVRHIPFTTENNLSSYNELFDWRDSKLIEDKLADEIQINITVHSWPAYLLHDNTGTVADSYNLKEFENDLIKSTYDDVTTVNYDINLHLGKKVKFHARDGSVTLSHVESTFSPYYFGKCIRSMLY